MQIDLNCDMGESFGTYELGYDAQAMPFVTSINVACGFHASDPDNMPRPWRWLNSMASQLARTPAIRTWWGLAAARWR